MGAPATAAAQTVGSPHLHPRSAPVPKNRRGRSQEDCFSPEPPYVSIQDQQHPLAAGSSRSRLLKEQSVSAAGDAADEILGGWSNMKYGSVRGAHCFHVKAKIYDTSQCMILINV